MRIVNIDEEKLLSSEVHVEFKCNFEGRCDL